MAKKTGNSKFESRQIFIGGLVDMSQQEEVDDPNYAKKEFDKFVSDLVAGKRVILEGPVVRALFRCRNSTDRLKPKTAKLLGISEERIIRKTTYAEALMHCAFVYKARLAAQHGKPTDPTDCWEAHVKNVAA